MEGEKRFFITKVIYFFEIYQNEKLKKNYKYVKKLC